MTAGFGPQHTTTARRKSFESHTFTNGFIPTLPIVRLGSSFGSGEHKYIVLLNTINVLTVLCLIEAEGQSARIDDLGVQCF